MTLQEFRGYVIKMVQRDGTPVIPLTQIADINALIQRGLNVYAAKTRVLYNNRVQFVPVIGYSQYSTYNAGQGFAVQPGTAQTPALLLNGVAIGMCKISQIVINGAPLAKCPGAAYDIGAGGGQIIAGNSSGLLFGESNEEDVMQFNPNYLTAPNGPPNFWFVTSPNNVQFDCPLDQVYANSWMSGNLYHTPLTQGNGGDAQVLDFPDEDLETAQMLCRNMLMRPLAQKKMQEYIGEVNGLMKERRGEAEDKTAGSGARGRFKGSRHIGLVN